MITVYGYGFDPPKPAGPPPTPALTYLLAAAAAWWVWTRWFRVKRVSNPQHYPRPRYALGFRMGDTVKVGKKRGVIVAQPTSGFHKYDVKLSDGTIRSYAVSTVRPA